MRRPVLPQGYWNVPPARRAAFLERANRSHKAGSDGRPINAYGADRGGLEIAGSSRLRYPFLTTLRPYCCLFTSVCAWVTNTENLFHTAAAAAFASSRVLSVVNELSLRLYSAGGISYVTSPSLISRENPFFSISLCNLL
jgi:hypothetical protein